MSTATDNCDADIDNDEQEPTCAWCAGDGYVWGYEFDDPLWYDADVRQERNRNGIR